MYQVKTYDNVAKKGSVILEAKDYQISPDFVNPDAILVHSTPLHNENFGDNLKCITRIGAGVNTIPVAELTKKGVCVFNCPGGNANAVKELTIAALIMAMRNGFKAQEWVHSLPDEEVEAGKTVEKGKEAFRGPELLGKTIGILGLGAIGARVAKACYDLGMSVIGYDPYLSNHKVNDLKNIVSFVNDVEELYEKSDIVSVHIPFNAQNKEFVGKAAIDKMKDGVYLVNYARGQVLDNDAVLEALESGKIKAFATDFPTPAQMKHPNVVFTPHLGAGTPEADENCSVMAAHQTIDYIENGNITNSVNLPNVSFARADGSRLCILHANKPGMLSKLTEFVSADGYNIENLVNKSRGEIAYTILDFDDELPNELSDKLTAVDGVIRVRLLK